jgi:pimeloyl-ACP methyl ester carboxylesterase
MAGKLMVLQQQPAYLRSPAGPRLAYLASPGRSPTVVFLPGFMSDMSGAKAAALSQFCAERGQAFLRFDYRGHGLSEGKFDDTGIDDWLQDALAIIDDLTEGPLILVGSSMGGWLAILAALTRQDRVAGLIGIAAAPDFTEELIWQQLSAAEQTTMMAEGAVLQPSEYGEKPYRFSRKLIEDGRKHLLLGKAIPLRCPVRLLQGMADLDVPFATALRIAEKLESQDVVISLIKDGDHRLSRDADLGRLCQMVADLTGLVRDRQEMRSAAEP